MKEPLLAQFGNEHSESKLRSFKLLFDFTGQGNPFNEGDFCSKPLKLQILLLLVTSRVIEDIGESLHLYGELDSEKASKFTPLSLGELMDRDLALADSVAAM